MHHKISTPDVPPTEQEIEEAMNEIKGFVDLTPHDFLKIYQLVHTRAATKFLTPPPAPPRTGWRKWLRPLSEPAPRVPIKDIGWSWLAAVVGIGLVAGLNNALLAPPATLWLVGSFGASAVLIYGAVNSPLAQPRNLIGGHLVSAIIGVATWQLLSNHPAVAATVAVATALAAMHWTRTLHPPGGATALIAVIGGDSVHHLGFSYVLLPVLGGSLIMLAVALVFNNIVKWREYPEYWI